MMNQAQAARAMFAAGLIDESALDAAEYEEGTAAHALAKLLDAAATVVVEDVQVKASPERDDDPTRGMSTADKNRYWAEQSRLKREAARKLQRTRTPQQVSAAAAKRKRHKKRAQRQARRR